MEKIQDYKISIWHDTRAKKANGKYPVKLRVYCTRTQKVKAYSLKIDLSIEEFKNIWLNPDGKELRGNNKVIKDRLDRIRIRADDEAKEIPVFNFSRFETVMFRKSSDYNNVKYHFDKAIEKNIQDDKISTAESFRSTFNSLAIFCTNRKKNKCKIEKLTFDFITVDWLKEYERFMLTTGKSVTTIGIYTRTLRVIFNNAIKDGDISESIYPFGKDKYKIPRSKKVKKALNAGQLNILFNAIPETDQQQEAKDFWFFSYACNGMNLKDIALLRYSDLQNDSFSYYRAKTFDNSEEKSKIIIYLNSFSKEVIGTYGNKDKSGFVFNIIDEDDTSVTQYRKINNFIRYINDHIKRIAKKNGLPAEISTYWARHSFATNSMRKGASIEFISEALNHSDVKVTKHYLDGFEDEAKKEFANQIMDF